VPLSLFSPHDSCDELHHEHSNGFYIHFTKEDKQLKNEKLAQMSREAEEKKFNFDDLLSF
jgi:hypothetical protein